MNYFVQFALIALICVAGEGITALLPFAFPASVSGMLVLFVLLILKAVKPDYIKEASGLLTQNMALFFTPLVVNMIESWDILKNVMLELLIICITATTVTFFVTAYTVRLVTGLQKKLRGDRK